MLSTGRSSKDIKNYRGHEEHPPLLDLICAGTSVATVWPTHLRSAAFRRRAAGSAPTRRAEVDTVPLARRIVGAEICGRLKGVVFMAGNGGIAASGQRGSGSRDT